MVANQTHSKSFRCYNAKYVCGACCCRSRNVCQWQEGWAEYRNDKRLVNDLVDMEKNSAVDLRPLAKCFSEKSRNREMNVQQHMSREFYSQVFPEAERREMEKMIEFKDSSNID